MEHVTTHPPLTQPVHLSTDAIEAGLDEIRRSPADRGVVELIVRRPAIDEREVLEEGTLDALGRAGRRHLA